MVTETPMKKSISKSLSKDKSSKASAEPTPGPSEEDEEEIIRCICGEYEEEEDVERDMICCDSCSAWQHNDCMGLAFAKGEEPDQYYCEKCKPENHKDLLDRMARGERPWEEVAERRRKEAEEKKALRRKKGKKGGRRGRPSESKTETSTPVPSAKAQSPSSAPSVPPTAPNATPGHDEDGHAPSSTPKRKFDEHQESPQSEGVSHYLSRSTVPTAVLTDVSQGPKPKQQRDSPPSKAESSQDTKQTKAVSNGPSSRQGSIRETAHAEVVETPEEIQNPARRSVASALVKLFVEQVTGAQKQGAFKLPQGKTAEEVGRQLGLSIEHAMYRNLCGGSGEPTDPYKVQMRAILFNVKRNTSLRDSLLVGSLLPDTLSRMSSQDMASKELQQKDAQIKQEAERQHIIIQEQGPRIKRTHKGEEIIEDDTHNVASEPVFSTAPRRVVADGSPTPGPNGNENGRAEEPQSIDTQMADAPSHDKPFGPIRSPGGTDHDQVFPEVATHIREPVPDGRVQADAEIDHLLRDEEEPDSPPYSPKDYQDEGTVWRGKVIMNPIGEFLSSAKHVGGADLSGRIPWTQLVPSTLLVNGRIEIQLASNYLCGLRFSASTDVSVISVSAPENPKDRTGFDNLFNYFADRKRYGVVGKHPLPSVMDTYLIPVEAGTTKKPDFLELLENNSLEESLLERTFLVVFVVKTGSSNPPSAQPPSHQQSQEPTNTASPLTNTAPTPQQHYFMPGQQATAQASPTPQAAFAGQKPTQGPSSQLQQPPMAGQYQQYHPNTPQSGIPATGLAAAIQVLGPQAHAPAIQQLLHQAPNADASQLGVVRDILSRQPDAASSYQALTEALYHATTNGHGPS